MLSPHRLSCASSSGRQYVRWCLGIQASPFQQQQQQVQQQQQQQVREFSRKVRRRVLPVPKFEKRLDVVIMGAPNAGKSVLLNCLVQTRIAAATRKRHTTRAEILGVFNHRNVQLAFYDTPGYVHRAAAAEKADTRKLRAFASESVSKADVVLLVVDAMRCRSLRYHTVFAEMVSVALQHAKKELVLVLNKVDLIEPKVELLELTRMLVSLINGVKLSPEQAHLAAMDTTTFMISALEDDGVVDMKNYLIALAEQKEWIIKRGQGSSGLSSRQRVEEMVLESLLEHTHEEIPYIADVECTAISSLRETRLKVEVDVWVDSGGQQRIVIGQQGRTLVKIRQHAVQQLERALGKEIILMLYVKLRSSRDQPAVIEGATA